MRGLFRSLKLTIQEGNANGCFLGLGDFDAIEGDEVWAADMEGE